MDTELNDIYLPFLQTPSRFAPLYFRTQQPASAWLETVRATVAELDREVLVSGGSTFAEEAESYWPRQNF